MQEIVFYLSKFYELFLSLWWIWLPTVLYFPAKYFWLYASRQIKFYDQIRWVLLEIIPPEEVPKTPKAMEDFFNAIWGLYDPPANVREFWLEGKWLASYSFEIVGKKDQAHFYIRVPATHKDLVVSNIYAEYPDAEVKEVSDYVYKFGKELPNKEYNLWGCDLDLTKPEIYPLKTYHYWEAEGIPEEKRIDPLTVLFEFISNLKEGEEVWIQIKISPISNDEHPYLKEAEKEINKWMKGESGKKPSPFEILELEKLPKDAFEVLLFGPPSEKPKAAALPRELGYLWLPPHIAEKIRQIGEKIKKYMYECNIRFLYIAPREIFSPPRGVAGTMGFFSLFSDVNLNATKPGKTKTKVAPWFFEERRLFVRKRKLFKFFCERRWPWHRLPYLLSTAELASLYHFPGKRVVPAISVPRIKVKPGAPPPTLPR